MLRADIYQHKNYTGVYSGLLDNLWLTLAIAGACLVAYEIEVQIPRRRGRNGTFQHIHVRIYRAAQRGWKRWRSGAPRVDHASSSQTVSELKTGQPGQSAKLEAARKRLGDREAWEFAYIFQPKSWALNRGPPLPRWPLMWIIEALRVRERDMPEKCGLDLTLHARFLRGAFFYTLLQTCVVLPILMPLHILYGPDDVARTSMLRAGIDSLVATSGRKWLWVHALLIWWITLTWTGTLLWMAWGALAYRRREIKRLTDRVRTARADRIRSSGGEEGARLNDTDRWSVADDSAGIKKFRTVMMVNVPPDMRDEEMIRSYFDYYLHQHRLRKGEAQSTGRIISPTTAGFPADKVRHRILQPGTLFAKQQAPKEVDLPPVTPTFRIQDMEKAPRASGEGAEEWNLPDDLIDSEVDEVIMVRKLGAIESLRSRRQDVLKDLELAHVNLARRVLKAVKKHKDMQARQGRSSATTTKTHPVNKSEAGIQGLNAAREEKLSSQLTRSERLDRLTAALGRFVDDEPDQRGEGPDTVWDVLHSLPRELLDPYQSLTHLKVTSVLRKANAPLVDYLTTKLSYLTALLDEARAKPLSSYPSASTAFVVLKDARTARLALKLLDSHPKRALACHTIPAPDWTDLLWPRLGKSMYRSEFVRGWVTFVAVWAFTLAWIFPVSFFCTLTTLTSIADLVPRLQTWLDSNPKAASAISSLAPVILVALLTIAICPILLVIANKAESIVTRRGIHNSVMERFWKFLMVNAVVFFAIGQGAIEAYLTAFRTANFDPLPLVASAFPTAAPYFASYLLLQVAIQPFFEIFRLGLPTIVYVFGTRVSKLPRQRASRTEYPTFSHFSQVPYQLLAGAIMHLFMILNPLVIPFTLLYYGACYVVWKKQFTFVYGRLYETNGRRSSIRITRYSLDALALGQFVLFAFFILNKAKGHAIATGILFFLTLIAKLIITRALQRRFDNLDIEEADILCPPISSQFGEEDVDPARMTESPPPGHESLSKTSLQQSSRFASLRSWTNKWSYATKSSTTVAPSGYRRPIPFDHVFFTALDEKIKFDPDERSLLEPTPSSLSSPLISDPRLAHAPDEAIHHPLAPRLVVRHPSLPPWEDIPPYQRSRAYEDQPAYTDDYDDFLWLPRDPLSTLDLDDTVELRLSLTTSAGGSGRISTWPEESRGEVEEMMQEVLPELETAPTTSTAPTAPSPPPLSPSSQLELSPQADSERRLLDDDISPLIGSEVEGFENSTVRHSLRHVAFAISAFRRPHTPTETSAEGVGGDISLRPLSSRGSGGSAPAETTSNPPMTQRTESGHSVFLMPRVSTPRPISIRQDSYPPRDEPGPAQDDFGPGISPRTDPAVPTPSSAPVPTRTSSSLSFAPASLRRSPSGRMPISAQSRSRTRATSRASAHSNTQAQGRLGGSAILRSASIISRDRSSSNISASQMALLNEVMEEERQASKSAKQEEQSENKREEAELKKEQERMKKIGLIDSESGLKRLSMGGSGVASDQGNGTGTETETGEERHDVSGSGLGNGRPATGSGRSLRSNSGSILGR